MQAFSRSSRGVVLTDEGRLLYDHVSEAFEALNEGEEKLKRSIELGVGQLKIGVSSTSANICFCHISRNSYTEILI